MEFKLKKAEELRMVNCAVASATVIPAGSLVALSSGLIIKAVAGSTAVGYCPNGSADGETTTEVTTGNDFTLTGTPDANTAVTDRGITCDIVGTTTVKIDIGASATDVLKVGIAEDSLTAGSTDDVEVRINKPLF